MASEEVRSCMVRDKIYEHASASFVALTRRPTAGEDGWPNDHDSSSIVVCHRRPYGGLAHGTVFKAG
jgi:hypothetical protein